MLKTVLAACALLCAFTITADARPRHHGAPASACVETDVMRPVCNGQSPGMLGNVPAGATIRVTMHRERHAAADIAPSSWSVGKPARYIAGRLICAINVGAALAERGIKGTGSALALSYLHWGHSAGGPVPGAVIVSARRGGGHVAIVSRVEGGVVYAWNATGGQSGWREIPYRHHVIDYRVPG